MHRHAERDAPGADGHGLLVVRFRCRDDERYAGNVRAQPHRDLLGQVRGPGVVDARAHVPDRREFDLVLFFQPPDERPSVRARRTSRSPRRTAGRSWRRPRGTAGGEHQHVVLDHLLGDGQMVMVLHRLLVIAAGQQARCRVSGRTGWPRPCGPTGPPGRTGRTAPRSARC